MMPKEGKKEEISCLKSFLESRKLYQGSERLSGWFNKKCMEFFIQIFDNSKFYSWVGSGSGFRKVLDPDLQNNIKNSVADPDP
jgi:hypothetical protein